MKKAISLEYKCRRCGQIISRLYSSETLNDKRVLNTILDDLNQVACNNLYSFYIEGQEVKTTIIHNHSIPIIGIDEYGFADIVGFDIKDMPGD